MESRLVDETSQIVLQLIRILSFIVCSDLPEFCSLGLLVQALELNLIFIKLALDLFEDKHQPARQKLEIFWRLVGLDQELSVSVHTSTVVK